MFDHNRPQEKPDRIRLPSHSPVTRRQQFRKKNHTKNVKMQKKKERKEAKKAAANMPKRRPGRPKGSKNKKSLQTKEAQEPSAESPKATPVGCKSSISLKCTAFRRRWILEIALKQKEQTRPKEAEMKSPEAGDSKPVSETSNSDQNNAMRPEPTSPNPPKAKRPKKIEQLDAKHPETMEGTSNTTTAEEGKKTKKERKPKKKKNKKKAAQKTEGLPEGEKAQDEEPAKESKKGSKKKAKKTQPHAAVDPEVKAEILATMKECDETSCCHPTYLKLDYDKTVYELSTYWSRYAVGVKVSTEALGEVKPKKHKGTKGKRRPQAKKRQVEYFSCPTWCTYTNLCLAKRYVT